MYDYLVIGMGLIGSAVLKYLSGVSKNTIGIGPAEPSSYSNHRGVFASHYDQARITRILDTDLVWATLAKRSILRYRNIEDESGIKFYSEVGCLRLVNSLETTDVAKTQRVGDTLGVKYEVLNLTDLQNKFPFFRFADNSYGLFEASNAGFINPPALIDAQLSIAQRNGAEVKRQTVVKVQLKDSHVIAHTDDGNQFVAEKALITAGAFTNCNNLLESKLAYKAYGRTVLLAKLSGAPVTRLASMPSLGFRNREDTTIYVLPPVQYPDGFFYVKIGGGIIDADMQSLQDFETFFHSGGSASTAKQLRQILESILPDLKPDSFTTRPCVVALTESDRPYIDTIVPSHVFVAAGGCGAAAKSSDEIGRLGALLAERETWHDDLEASQFSCRFLQAKKELTGCSHSEVC